MEVTNLPEVDGISSLTLKQFQDQVLELLLRHRSLLNVLLKFQQSGAAANRSVVKSITECGCIQVHAAKQEYHPEMTLDEAKDVLRTHVSGHLCEQCIEVVSSELGRYFLHVCAK